MFSPNPRPSHIPAAMAITFLVAPAISQPTTSVPVYTRKVRVCSIAWTSRGEGLVGQRDHGGRRLTLGHLPGQVRSAEHAGRFRRGHFGHHLGHPEVGAGLDPLGQADHRRPGARGGARSSSTSRNPCDGTAISTTSAPRPPRRGRGRPQALGQGQPGQVVGVLPSIGHRRDAARATSPTAGSRSGQPAGAATAVPHDPAPTTATLLVATDRAYDAGRPPSGATPRVDPRTRRLGRPAPAPVH